MSKIERKLTALILNFIVLSCLLACFVESTTLWLNPSSRSPTNLDCGVEPAYLPSPKQAVTYTWSLNGTVIYSGSEPNYAIDSPNNSHVGDWRCQITFLATGQSLLGRRLLVDLASWQPPDPRLVNSSITPINLSYGRTSIVTAPLWTLKSQPPPIIEWYDSNESSASLRHRPSQYYITHNGSLIIFDPKQTMTLRAVAKNPKTGDEFSFFMQPLLIEDSAETAASTSVFLVTPTDVSTILTQSVTFECIPRSTDVVVEWFRVVANKDGGFERQDLAKANSMQFQISKNRGIFLTINYVQLEDAGEYQCVAKGGDLHTWTGRNASARLSVMFAPVFPTDAVDREQTIDLESSVTWPLSAFGTPAPNASWFFNGKQLVAGFIDPALTLLDSGGLTLSNVRLDHSGFYQCLADNSVDETIFTIHVSVRASPPQILSQQADKTIQSGDSVSFSCRAIGAPQPRIAWSKNGDRIVNSGHLEVLADGQLLIRSATVADEGLYSCVATNSRGNASTTSSLRVMTRTRIVLPPQNNSAQIGTSVQFYCSIQSDPRSAQLPKVSWYRNRVPVDVSRDSRFAVASNNSLLISQIRSDDGGTYECRVESNYGSDSRSATLTVLELPFPPVVLSAVPLAPDQPRAVRLTWAPGFDGNSPIINYIVEIKEISRPGLLGPSSPSSSTAGYAVEWSEVATFAASSEAPLEGIINNLLPSRTYAFRVRARNSLGAGNPSGPSANVTLPAQPPSGSPQNFVASSPSNGTIIIQWQPPAIEDQNGDISAYRVRYRLSGYNPPIEYRNLTDIGAFQRSYSIEGLIPHKQYDVSIAAVNERGVGVFSKDEHVWTRQGRPSVAPSHIDAKPRDSTSILVSWTQPDPQKINGILTQYRIFLAVVSDDVDDYGRATDISNINNKAIVIVEPFDAASPASQSRLVENLAKYTNYSVQVAAETEGGLGPASDPVVYARTLEDRPDAPSSLKIVDNIDTSMTAVWSPPESANGILTQYIVEYSPKAQTFGVSQSLRKILVNPEVSNVTLTNLLHDTLYTVSISASTRVGVGRAKTIDVKSGVKPELADPPSDLLVPKDNVTAFSALVTFTPGNDRGSPVSSYVVETLINGAWVSVCNATPFFAAELTTSENRGAVNVTSLQPFSTYQLRLFPVNAAGKNNQPSPTSAAFKTDASIPSNVRSPVLVRALNSTSLVVKWSPLNADEWSGTPSHYLIEYRSQSTQTWLSVRTSDPFANAMYVTDLRPWTFYDIRLTAWNLEVGGSLSPTEIATWRTWEAAPMSAPQLATATARNSSCIFATWRELANVKDFANGLILGYKIMALQVASRKRIVETFYGNKTLTGVVCGLSKYTEYSVSVAAFTRMGDGPFSTTAVFARTSTDLPDPPSRVHFNQIGDTFVEIWWDEPVLKGADEVLGYRVRAVSEKPSTDVAPFYTELSANHNNMTVAGLKKDTQYRFMIGSRNQIGWSVNYAIQLVYTFSRTVESTAMRPPSQPLSVSAKPTERDSNGENQPASITISWRSPFDAYLPVRNYSLQYQNNQSTLRDFWAPWNEDIPWNATSFVAQNLKPHEFYRFRVYATNDAGAGTPSEPTGWVQPSPSPPATVPGSFTVKPTKSGSVEVSWDSVDGAEYYDVLYCKLDELCLQSNNYKWKRVAATFPDVGTARLYTVSVDALDDKNNYEFFIEAFNRYGTGPRSAPPIVLYVGDVVPSAAPIDVQATLDSSTSVTVTWKTSKELVAIAESLIGYRVIVTPRVWVSRTPPAILALTVPASQLSLRVSGLTKYTQYAVSVAAMSLGGDGPASSALLIQTPEDIPTAPTEPRFTDILLDAVTFRWAPPSNPNGNITVYEVTVSGSDQQPATIDATKLKSVKVQVPGEQLFYSAQSLIQGALYRFSVRASTSVGFGPAIESDVKTEPPPNAPDKPINLQAAFLGQAAYVRLTWTNPRPQALPVDPDARIVGYLVEVRRVSTFPARGDTPPPVLPWIRVFSTDSPYASTQVSLDVVPPGVRGSDVQFRVAARSVAGQSWFSEPSTAVYVPRPGELASTDGRPYYLQHWFLGLIALAMLLILTVLIASLVVSGYRRRHRKTAKHLAPRATVITGEHRRSSNYNNGIANNRANSHMFGNGPDNVNPTNGDNAGANGGGAFGVGLRGNRHNMYNSSIHSRTSRSRRPRQPPTATHIPYSFSGVGGGCVGNDDEDGDACFDEQTEEEAQKHPLWHMHVNVAKAHVQVNVQRSHQKNRRRSPPRPSLAGYEPSESAHSATTSVIGGPVSTAPHFSVVPSANAIASELASITGAKQRALGGVGVAAANSAMDDFSGSQTSTPLDGDDDNNYPADHHDKSSIPPSEELNETADASVTAHSTFQVGQPMYGHTPSMGNYASSSNIMRAQQAIFSTNNSSFGFAQAAAATASVTGGSVISAATPNNNNNNANGSTPNGNATNSASHQLPSHYVLNNVAGTRQPLTTNFSSFV